MIHFAYKTNSWQTVKHIISERILQFQMFSDYLEEITHPCGQSRMEQMEMEIF